MKANTALLIIATTGLFSCGQTSTSKPDTHAIEDFNSTRRYVYADEAGKLVQLTNSLPKGSGYTAPDGRNYFRVIYWSGITNQTEHPLEISIDFPEELYEVPGVPGSYYKILVPPDTMTVDKESSGDYGMTSLKIFLDSSIDKTSSVKRVIHPKETTGFYFLLLSQSKDTKPGATIRTSLQVRGQQLVYTISRYASKEGHPLLGKREISCGTINLKNLVLQE
jgi:hypothetical protein